MTGSCFIGIDGGGTKTEFLCIDAAGAVKAQLVAGTSYHVQIGLAALERMLREGVAALLAQAGHTMSEVGYAFVGLPAFGEDSTIDPMLASLCARIFSPAPVRCDNDMVCGWAGSLGGEDGINLIAGTGSIGFGRRRQSEARVGGWSEWFSDEGSAYWIAIQALNAFTRMSDGRLRRGPLHGIIAAALDLSNDLDLCARIMGDGGMGRDQIAALAPLAHQAADAGDSVAADILDRAAAELAAIAIALREKLAYEDSERTPLSWSGGVLAGVPPTREGLVRRLTAHGDFSIVSPRHKPALGAALLARRLASET